MGRPTTKKDLLEAAAEQYEKLMNLIDTMPEEVRNGTFLFEDRDKNIRDVLIHLYEWHQLVLGWVPANLKGDTKPFLPAPYNWKTYPDMNVGFWEKHQNTSYDEARAMLQDSHEKMLELIESFTNDELFEKKHFTWTGTSNLGSYCVSSTSSHYDWAMKKIRKHIKACKDAEKQ